MSKIIIDEKIIREVINTLYLVRLNILNITALDSPQEVAMKEKKNDCAIARAILRSIDIIQQGKRID